MHPTIRAVHVTVRNRTVTGVSRSCRPGRPHAAVAGDQDRRRMPTAVDHFTSVDERTVRPWRRVRDDTKSKTLGGISTPVFYSDIPDVRLPGQLNASIGSIRKSSTQSEVSTIDCQVLD